MDILGKRRTVLARRRRYKNIYSKKNRKVSTLKATLIVAGLFIIALIGYAISGPLMKLINGELTYDPSSVSSTSPSISDSSKGGDTSQDTSSTAGASEQSSSDSETPASFSDLSKIKGVYMPTSILLDEALFEEFIKSSNEKGFDTVVFDLKDSAGHVYYNSQNESVITAGAKVTGAVDLSSRVAKMKEYNITPIARIYAFKDPIASFVLPDSYVWYQAPGTRWVDNYIDKGGKPWLNPESEVAQRYIKEIALEVVSNGVNKIIMDGVTYPSGVALELAYFGERSKTDKLGVIDDFSKDMEKAISDNGGTFILMNTSLDLLSDNQLQYGGNPAKIGVNSISVSIFPASITAPLDFDGKLISVPQSMPKETTSLIIAAIKKHSSGSYKNIIPFIQYYDGYENGDYTMQIAALEENNIFCYVLYNEQGVY